MDVDLAPCEIIQDLTIYEAYSMIGGSENKGGEFQPFVHSTAYFLFLART
jgi:hypothetical protein